MKHFSLAFLLYKWFMFELHPHFKLQSCVHRGEGNYHFYRYDIRWRLVYFWPCGSRCGFCYVYWIMLNTCIMYWLCSVTSSLYNVDSASRAIYQERKKLSRVHWNLWARYANPSIYLCLMTVEKKVAKWQCHWTLSSWGQVTAARNGCCTPGLPQFLNHPCQIVKASGSVGDELLVGVCEFCYLCARGGWFCFGRAMMYEWLGAGECTQPLINDHVHTQTWECVMRLLTLQN